MIEIYIVPTHRDPQFLFPEEYETEIEGLKTFFETLPRNYWKRKIIEGEELGIINFSHKLLEESTFVFNNTKNFKEAISLTEDFINDELMAELSAQTDEFDTLPNPSIEILIKRLQELETKPPKIN